MWCLGSGSALASAAAELYFALASQTQGLGRHGQGHVDVGDADAGRAGRRSAIGRWVNRALPLNRGVTSHRAGDGGGHLHVRRSAWPGRSPAKSIIDIVGGQPADSPPVCSPGTRRRTQPAVPRRRTTAGEPARQDSPAHAHCLEVPNDGVCLERRLNVGRRERSTCGRSPGPLGTRLSLARSHPGGRRAGATLTCGAVGSTKTISAAQRGKLGIRRSPEISRHRRPHRLPHPSLPRGPARRRPSVRPGSIGLAAAASRRRRPSPAGTVGRSGCHRMRYSPPSAVEPHARQGRRRPGGGQERRPAPSACCASPAGSPRASGCRPTGRGSENADHAVRRRLPVGLIQVWWTVVGRTTSAGPVSQPTGGTTSRVRAPRRTSAAHRPAETGRVVGTYAGRGRSSGATGREHRTGMRTDQRTRGRFVPGQVPTGH